MTTPHWIPLEGAVNARDLGGLLTTSGQPIAPRRLLRSDNLQQLSESDISLLFGDLRLRDVVDLRTPVEVQQEGPGPVTRHGQIAIHHLSLFPEGGHNTDVEADAPTGPDATNEIDRDPTRWHWSPADRAVAAGRVNVDAVLPWQGRPNERIDGNPAVGFYLRYLAERPDSILTALRVIAYSTGSTLVHCAAGKDRTGVVVALALDLVGVHRDLIVADYVATGDRLEQILARLRASPTYAQDLDRRSAASHMTRPHTMATFLQALDERHGGVQTWLDRHGWRRDDTVAMQAKLLS